MLNQKIRWEWTTWLTDWPTETSIHEEAALLPGKVTGELVAEIFDIWKLSVIDRAKSEEEKIKLVLMGGWLYPAF